MALVRWRSPARVSDPFFFVRAKIWEGCLVPCMRAGWFADERSFGMLASRWARQG